MKTLLLLLLPFFAISQSLSVDDHKSHITLHWEDTQEVDYYDVYVGHGIDCYEHFGRTTSNSKVMHLPAGTHILRVDRVVSGDRSILGQLDYVRKKWHKVQILTMGSRSMYYENYEDIPRGLLLIVDGAQTVILDERDY